MIKRPEDLGETSWQSASQEERNTATNWTRRENTVPQHGAVYLPHLYHQQQSGIKAQETKAGRETETADDDVFGSGVPAAAAAYVAHGSNSVRGESVQYKVSLLFSFSIQVIELKRCNSNMN